MKRTSMLSTSGRGQNAEAFHHEWFEHRVVPSEERERAVSRAARGRSQAIGVLLLHQQDGAAHHVALLEQPLEDRCGDVVGNVADDGEPVGLMPRGDLGQIDLEEIGVHQLEAGDRIQLLAEQLDQPVVHLDRDHARRAGREVSGQRAGSGADLDHHVVIANARLLDDALGEVGAREEVLAEALARAQAAAGERHLEPRWLGAFRLRPLANVRRGAAAPSEARAPSGDRRWHVESVEAKAGDEKAGARAPARFAPRQGRAASSSTSAGSAAEPGSVAR